MIKKKHAKVEEVKNADAGEVIDSKDINSQDKSSSESDSGSSENNEKLSGTEEDDNTGKSEQITESAKEAVREMAAEAKLAEMQDRYLRLSAEFDNYRKRTLREKIELTRHAGESILVNIIPVMDDFERALKSMDASTDTSAMKTGIDLIYNKFREFLIQNGIREIEAMNSDFNVDLHEAISKIPASDESLKGKVVEVVQKGYYLHDKVMRFAKVIVGE